MALPIVGMSVCTGCGICADECPSACFDLAETAVMARPNECTECGVCMEACPNEAIWQS